jgi:hypothetical protein
MCRNLRASWILEHNMLGLKFVVVIYTRFLYFVLLLRVLGMVGNAIVFLEVL